MLGRKKVHRPSEQSVDRNHVKIHSKLAFDLQRPNALQMKFKMLRWLVWKGRCQHVIRIRISSQSLHLVLITLIDFVFESSPVMGSVQFHFFSVQILVISSTKYSIWLLIRQRLSSGIHMGNDAKSAIPLRNSLSFTYSPHGVVLFAAFAKMKPKIEMCRKAEKESN